MDTIKLEEKKLEFKKLVMENISRNGVDQIIHYLENETDFFKAPASSKYHGAYAGGLLEHSINVFKMLSESEILKKENISKESIAIVSLFHDICKVNMYVEGTRNVKKDGVWVQVPTYNIQEKMPYGHGEKSVYILMKIGGKYGFELSDEEALAIRYHMGGFTDSVKGGSYALTSVFNSNILALELHLADMRATYYLENQ